MKFEFGTLVGMGAVAAILVAVIAFWPSSPPVSFAAEVKPLLVGKCLPCHHSGTLSGNLNLESKRTAFGGSARGTFIVPGDAENSLVYTLTGEHHGGGPKMPEVDGVELTDEERAILHDWINRGAEWPEGDEGHLEPLDPKPNSA
jgi:hypothetical protein